MQKERIKPMGKQAKKKKNNKTALQHQSLVSGDDFTGTLCSLTEGSGREGSWSAADTSFLCMKGSIQLPRGEMLLALGWDGAGRGDTHTQVPGACCAQVQNDKAPPEYGVWTLPRARVNFQILLFGITAPRKV